MKHPSKRRNRSRDTDSFFLLMHQIVGDLGASEWIPLPGNDASFARGAVDSFNVSGADVNDLSHVYVRLVSINWVLARPFLLVAYSLIPAKPFMFHLIRSGARPPMPCCIPSGTSSALRSFTRSVMPGGTTDRQGGGTKDRQGGCHEPGVNHAKFVLK